jgi:hypothetical protein
LDQIVYKFEYDEYLLDVDGGVGGLNCTPYLATPIVLLEMFPIPKIHGISMVTLTLNPIFQPSFPRDVELVDLI